MHLLDLHTISVDQLRQWIDTALAVKADPARYAQALAGQSLYMLFEKTSTRTALSFALGMQELGGRYFLQAWEDSNFPLGAIEDETRYVAHNVDGIMARLKSHATIEQMAAWSTVPVINGCCNRYHPCQGLADLLTIHEFFGGWQARVLYLGVWNNIANTLAGSLPRLGGELLALTPVVNAAPDSDLLAQAAATGRFTQLDPSMDIATLRKLVATVDVVYTDTWIDMESFHDPACQPIKEARLAAMLPYQVNAALLAGSGCRVMHDMPMHAGVEITREVIEAHIATILQQAENRKHAQKGVLLHLLGAADFS